MILPNKNEDRVMTREEIEELKGLAASMGLYDDKNPCKRAVILGKAIKALEQQPCKDTISRTRAIERLKLNFPISDGADNSRDRHRYMQALADTQAIREMPSVTPQPKVKKCKDCKWWKDSDGVYRRGIHAESQCPINRKEVLEGNGYCFMYEPQERSKK